MIDWFNGFIIGFGIATALILIPIGWFAYYMDKNFKYIKKHSKKVGRE